MKIELPRRQYVIRKDVFVVLDANIDQISNEFNNRTYVIPSDSLTCSGTVDFVFETLAKNKAVSMRYVIENMFVQNLQLWAKSGIIKTVESQINSIGLNNLDSADRDAVINFLGSVLQSRSLETATVNQIKILKRIAHSPLAAYIRILFTKASLADKEGPFTTAAMLYSAYPRWFKRSEKVTKISFEIFYLSFCAVIALATKNLDMDQKEKDKIPLLQVQLALHFKAGQFSSIKQTAECAYLMAIYPKYTCDKPVSFVQFRAWLLDPNNGTVGDLLPHPLIVDA